MKSISPSSDVAIMLDSPISKLLGETNSMQLDSLEGMTLGALNDTLLGSIDHKAVCGATSPCTLFNSYDEVSNRPAIRQRMVRTP